MKIGKGSKRAIITSNWMSVVESQKTKEGDILMCWFRRSTFHGVKVVVDKIEPGAFGLGTKKYRRILEHEGLL